MHRNLRSTLDILSTVLVIAAAGAVLWRVVATPDAPVGPGPAVEDVKNLKIEAGVARGLTGTGGLALIEFSDYECPFCGRHAQETAPELRRLFIEKGQLQHIVLNYPLDIHPRAQKASEAAECAAKQGRFWEMHDALFRNQMALEVSDLLNHAEKLALDKTAFQACLSDGLTAAVIRADVAEGRRLGVNSTPSFFLGRIGVDRSIQLLKRITGAQPLHEFKSAIEDLIQTQIASHTSP